MTVADVRDVPAPPPDAALPMLPTSLNAAAMEELLGARLDGVAVRSCFPCYVRYKPGTNCIVQYRLVVEELACGELHELSAHAKLYTEGRAQRVWSTGALRALAEQATRWTTGTAPPFARAAHLPELDAVLQIYPVDAALPVLSVAASEAGRARVLRQLLRGDDGGGVALVRYKPARKALLRYDASGGSVYAKVYAHERGPRLLDAHRTLRARGVPTARPLAYLPSLRLLAHEEAPGTPLRSLRGTEGFVHGARAAGAALARLHEGPPVDGLARHTRADEGAALAAAARTIGAIRPDLREEAAAICAAVVEHLCGLAAAPATVHGDFYDDQVLVAHAGAVLLDLDTVVSGDPLLDVGNFLAHLSADGGEEHARTAFLDAYGPASPDAVRPLEAAALFKLAVAPFRHLDPDWPAAVERRMRLAASLLDDVRPKPARRVDPSLPQLAVLREPALVRLALEPLYEEGVEISAATVVRHKASRRCTLRYDVASAPFRPAERLYGKTFASERGPRVYRSLRALAEAQAFGPTVGLPEPVAYVGRLKLLLQREVAGVPARDRILEGDVELAVSVADALAALHSSAVQLEREHTLAHEFAILREHTGRVATVRPRALRAVALLETAAASAEWRLQPVHRDFYYDQLLVDGHALGVLDLDDAAMSEPAVDVANFLAHLRLLALEAPLRARSVDAFGAAFAARAKRLDPRLDPMLVRLLESATLVRLACIHEPRSVPLLDAAEAVLRSIPVGGR